MSEREAERLPDGSYRITIEGLPEVWPDVMKHLAFKHKMSISEAIKEALRVGVFFLKDEKDGGAGGVLYFEQDNGDISLVVSNTLLPTAQALFPDVPVRTIPDPLAQNPYPGRHRSGT